VEGGGKGVGVERTGGCGEYGEHRMTLTEKETKCLAYLVAIRHLDYPDMWFEWEDYPYLSEQSFIALDKEIQGMVRNNLRQALRLMEQTWDIDSVDLLERASEEDTE